MWFVIDKCCGGYCWCDDVVGVGEGYVEYVVDEYVEIDFVFVDIDLVDFQVDEFVGFLDVVGVEWLFDVLDFVVLEIVYVECDIVEIVVEVMVIVCCCIECLGWGVGEFVCDWIGIQQWYEDGDCIVFIVMCIGV